MSHVKAPFKIRLKNSARGLLVFAKKPHYIVFAAISSFLISGLIVWSLNFELVRYILLEAPISSADKIRFFWDTQLSIYTTYSSAQANGIILFSILFGINISLILYVLRNKSFKDIPKKSGGTGLLFAVLSGGCIACGTSILAPILITIGATSSIAVAQISLWINWLGSILVLYSIYKLGGVIRNEN